MLQRGDQVPRFRVTTIDGRAVDYSTIWQQWNLVLVALSSEGGERARSYARQLSSHEFEPDTECVVTEDPVEGLPGPGVLVADRWGEIVHATTSANIEDLPSVEEILDWVEYLRKQCPECEGEAK
jgi:peroxiredoxin